MIDFKLNTIVRLDKKIVGNIKESMADGRGPYPNTAGYFYQPKRSQAVGDIFPTIVEVKNTL